MSTHTGACHSGKQCSCLYTRAILLGKCPKPLNDFGEIGCVPTELNINLSSESESGIFRLMAFRQIRFFLISVDRHLAKVSAHILYPKLRHPRLYQAEFFFIYEEFDLYRSLTIPVVWHLDYSLLLRNISNQTRSIILYAALCAPTKSRIELACKFLLLNFHLCGKL